MPIRLSGETDTDQLAEEQDRAAQSEQMEGIVDEMSSGSGGPKRMRTSCLRVSSVNAMQKPSARTEESIAKSRAEHIKHLLETGAVKDGNRDNAIKTGAKILSGKMVDDAHKEKSRYCAREFAMYKDPSVFAAASDVDNTSLIDLLAVKRGHGIMCFDAVAAFGQAPETELIFIEAPEEHRAIVDQHVLWQCLKVDHFIDTLLSQDCPAQDRPGSFKQSLKSPTIFYE